MPGTRAWLRRDAANDETVVVDNPSLHRFEIRTGDELAFLSYRRSGSTLRLVHTEVPESQRHKGLGDLLAAAAFEQARAQGLTVVPICSFVKDYIERHPEVRPLISHQERQAHP